MLEQLLKIFERKRLLSVIFVFFTLYCLTGCAPYPLDQTDNSTSTHQITPTLGNPSLDLAVQEYLEAQTDFTWQTEEGSSNICVFDKLDNNDLFPHYLWVRCGEFVLKNGQLEESSGSSLPAMIDYPNELSFFDLTKFSHQIPGNGSLHVPSIRKIFPIELQDLVLEYDATEINKNIKQSAEMELTIG